MSDEDRHLLWQAMHALSDARRLWPQRHPASGMIVGIDDDCRQTYDQITATRDAILARLAVKEDLQDALPVHQRKPPPFDFSEDA